MTQTLSELPRRVLDLRDDIDQALARAIRRLADDAVMAMAVAVDGRVHGRRA